MLTFPVNFLWIKQTDYLNDSISRYVGLDARHLWVGYYYCKLHGNGTF